MEQLINGGTSNVEHGDFIHLRSRESSDSCPRYNPHQRTVCYTVRWCAHHSAGLVLQCQGLYNYQMRLC